MFLVFSFFSSFDYACRISYFSFHSLLQMPLLSTVARYTIHAHTLIFMNNVAVINPWSQLHFNTSLDPLYFEDQAGSVRGSDCPVRFSVVPGLDESWIFRWHKDSFSLSKSWRYTHAIRTVLSSGIKKFGMWAWILSQDLCVVFTVCAVGIFLVYPFLYRYRYKLHVSFPDLAIGRKYGVSWQQIFIYLSATLNLSCQEA